jgi:hypothetical protein
MVATLSTHRAVTYGDLPDNPPDGVFLTCPECDYSSDYGTSAHRGDYCHRHDDDEIRCGLCGGEMELVRRVVVLKAYRKP